MSSDEFFGWGLAILGAVCLVGWLAWEAFHAPTEVESTPLDDLLDASAGGDNLAWTEPVVLAGVESLEYAGDCCVDCGKPATRYVPFAMSSIGAPIEEALCEEHADYATSDEAGSES